MDFSAMSFLFVLKAVWSKSSYATSTYIHLLNMFNDWFVKD